MLCGWETSERKAVVIKTPWTARYRVGFCTEHRDTDPKYILFTDAKKFCLYWMRGDAGVSNAYMSTEDPNVARGQKMTDAEYVAWRAQFKPLPKDKAKGLMLIPG